MKTATIQDVLSWKPCHAYTEEVISRLFTGRNELTALDMLNIDSIPAKDRLWAVLREEMIDAPILHEFACRCAEAALELIGNPDPRSVAAIEAKRKWIKWEITDNELAEACSTAWAAVWAAVWAAEGAARAAARAAAGAAAWAAAWAAEGAAEGAAVWAAARAAANEKQINMLKSMLEEE